MEPNMLCSEDHINPAIASCFCCFPLLTLCADHLAKHSMDTQGFIHFHLPLHAAQAITTKAAWAKYEPKLLRLYRGGKSLMENSDELEQFEGQIEAKKQEIVNIIEDAKQQIADLRGKFNAEAQAAIAETRAHALEDWHPGSESLSSTIWNFGKDDQWSIRLFQLSLDEQQMKSAVSFSINTDISSLSRFSLAYGSEKRMSYEQIMNAVGELQRRIEELKTENANLCRENQGLQAACTRLSEELKANTDIRVEQLAKGKAKLQFEYESKIKRKKLEIATLKKTQTEETKQLREELALWKSGKDQESILMEQGTRKKDAGRYLESAEYFRKAWEMIGNKGWNWKKTAAAGTALVEVLGLHLGQFTEAGKIVDDALRYSNNHDSHFDDEITIKNLKSAILFHSHQNSDCEAACLAALKLDRGKPSKADLFCTAFYYLIHALYAQKKTEEAVSCDSQYSGKWLFSKSEFLLLLKFSIAGKVASQGTNYTWAEGKLKEAVAIAKKFPTSIIAANNLYTLGKLYYKTSRPNEAKSTLLDAHVLFSRYFPGSIYSAFTLISLAAISKDQEQTAEAISWRTEAHRVLERFHPTNGSIAVNLTCLAGLIESSGQAGDAEKAYLQARSHYAAYSPTSSDAASNLNKLAHFYLDMGRNEEAKQCASSAREIGKSGNYEKQIQSAERLIEKISALGNS